MDRMSDSGSDDWGSNPHRGTNEYTKNIIIMKQHTDKIQTQKLKEMGFPSPQSISGYDTDGVSYDYSIGELIGLLGEHLMDISTYRLCDFPINYRIRYRTDINKNGWTEIQGELIDRLFDACLELKRNKQR